MTNGYSLPGNSRFWEYVNSGIPSEYDDGERGKALGFAASDDDVQRFVARYKLAKSFQSIDIDVQKYYLREITVDTYSSLFRVFLAWSAFEKFQYIIGLKTLRYDKKERLNGTATDRDGTDELLSDYNPERISKIYLENDPERQFLQFLYDQTDRQSSRNQLEPYLLGNASANVAPPLQLLASTIRHIFAHGSLTPHSGGKKPHKTKIIADSVAEFLLDVMEQEFAKRVDGGLNTINQ